MAKALVNRGGRKPKLPAPDGEVLASVLAAVADAASDRAICMELGIAPSTWTRWFQAAAEGREPFRTFCAQVNNEKAKLMRKCSRTLVNAAAFSKVTVIAARTITHPDNRVEVLEPERTIHEPGSPSLALTILKAKDREAWSEQSQVVVANVDKPADNASADDIAIWRSLMGRT